jgi:hypothetical protein
MAKEKWDVISPDGFSISVDQYYSSKEKAVEAFEKWKERYKMQGYYSSNRGRIPLNDLILFCKFINLNDKKQ